MSTDGLYQVDNADYPPFLKNGSLEGFITHPYSPVGYHPGWEFPFHLMV